MFYSRTLKTADNSGYTMALPAGGCSRLAVGADSGECWIEFLVNQPTAPETPTNALITSVAGVGGAKPAIKLTANTSRILDLSSGYGEDNTGLRFTHYRVWAVSAGFVEVLGA